MANRIAFLTLGIDIGAVPFGEALARGRAVEGMAPLERLLVGGVQVVEKLGPARVRGQDGSFLPHQAAKFLNAELGYQELNAGAIAVFLFPEAGKDAGDGLGDGQQFFGGHELVEKLGLVWHRAQAAADVELKAALFLAVDGLDCGDAA